MTLKIAKVFIVIFTVLLFCAAAYIGIRNISYFDVSEVEVEFVGPVLSNISSFDRITSPLKGLNIFEINVNQLRNQIKTFEGVQEVFVKKSYPGKILITINFNPYVARCYFKYQDNTYYFLADSKSIIETDKEVFDYYSPLVAIELSSDYGFMLLKWGVDEGFAQMMELASILINYTLINYASYDNNNSSDFGCMELSLPSVHAILNVQDPVKQDRLLEALNIIIRNYKDSNEVKSYDLYSNALVKRAGGL